MKKKGSVIIGITAVIVCLAVAFLVWISAEPYAFSGCAKKKRVRREITNIRVEIFSESGESVYTCAGTYGSVTLKPNTDYTLKISSPEYHYGNPNGMVDFGYMLFNYEDIGVSFDNETISITERAQEDDKVGDQNWSGYDNLHYTLRGSECADKTIELSYSSEFKSKHESFGFTPCSFKISFA